MIGKSLLEPFRQSIDDFRDFCNLGLLAFYLLHDFLHEGE